MGAEPDKSGMGKMNRHHVHRVLQVDRGPDQPAELQQDLIGGRFIRFHETRLRRSRDRITDSELRPNPMRTGAGDEERFRSVPPVLYEEQPSLGATGNWEGVVPCAANAAIARVLALNGAL